MAIWQRLKRFPILRLKSAKIWGEYAGQTGALVDGKVVAGGATTREALENAQKSFPDLPAWKIGVISLPPRKGVWVL